MLCFCHYWYLIDQPASGVQKGNVPNGPRQWEHCAWELAGLVSQRRKVLFSQADILTHCGRLAGQRADTGLDTACRDSAQTLDIQKLSFAC